MTTGRVLMGTVPHDPDRHSPVGWVRTRGRITGVCVCFRGRIRYATALPRRHSPDRS